MPSTAANYFHLLRTHMLMPFRKPLIVVAPKKLLRYKGANSTFEEMNDDKRFLPVIGDQNTHAVADHQIRKIVLCSGQVYYDLAEERKSK